MNSYLAYITAPASPAVLQGALLFLRVGIGALMAIHGFDKLRGGAQTWRSVGAALGYLGIHFLPVVWGLVAASTEFFGGALLAVGLGTRVASFLLSCMMLVAVNMHIRMGDPYRVYSFGLSLLVVFITFVIIGSGTISVDHYLRSSL